MSEWAAQAEGPRTYAIDVQSARFEMATNQDGQLIAYGDARLMNLVLEGPINYLDEDGNITGQADPTDPGAEFPDRSFTMGPDDEFPDEDGTGVKLTLMGRKAPRSRFDGGQLFLSMIDVATGPWLGDNFGNWNEAESWVGHRLVIQPTYRTNEDGSKVYRKGTDADGNKRQQLDSICVGIDEMGLQVAEG